MKKSIKKVHKTNIYKYIVVSNDTVFINNNHHLMDYLCEKSCELIGENIIPNLYDDDYYIFDKKYGNNLSAQRVLELQNSRYQNISIEEFMEKFKNL